MNRLFITLIGAALVSPLLTSCVLSDAQLNDILSAPPPPPPPPEKQAIGHFPDRKPMSTVPFKYGDILSWQTSAGKGTMKVVYASKNKFKLEQFNEYNRLVGNMKMEGEIFPDGKCVINNPKWNEVWNGNIDRDCIVGKVNNFSKFKIWWNVAAKNPPSVKPAPKPAPKPIAKPSPKPAPKPVANKLPFKRGEVLRWESSVGKGTMKVVSVSSKKFKMEQTNERNRAAGTMLMDGEILPNGKCVIKNPKWSEVWNGNIGDDSIAGDVNGRSKFKITRKSGSAKK